MSSIVGSSQGPFAKTVFPKVRVKIKMNTIGIRAVFLFNANHLLVFSKNNFEIFKNLE